MVTYVHGPELLPHMVGSEEVSDAGQLQQEPVLEAEHRGRPDNGGLWEDMAGHLFSDTLQGAIRTFLPSNIRAGIATLVLKNSQVESGFAL